MTQSVETTLRTVIENYLKEHPLRESVSIKIINNKVIIKELVTGKDLYEG